MGNAQLVQTATPPSSPSVPRTKLNVAAGAVLGAILGIVLAVIWYRFDGRLRSPEELSAEYQLPLLGVVSRSRGLNVASRRSNREARLPPAAAEQFRTIRARLRYLNRDHDLRSILVTSAAAGDGKSTIAWGLARAIAMNAEGGVLLIEADLRRPSLARDHGLRAYPGLADVLAQGISLDIVIQTVVAASFGKQREGSDFPAETGHGQSENGDETLAGGGSSETRFKYRRGSAPPQSQPLRAQQAHLKMSASVHPANGLLDTGPTMDVIVAGAIPSNSAELLDSSAMSRLMQAATEQYKYVVLDGPPASIVSDWLPLVAHASGIVVVSSMRNASKGNAERLRSELDNLNAPVLGLVVNNANRRDERSWGYQRPSESYHPAARTAADAGNSAGDDPENGNSVTDSTVESKAARA
ncbi:MAG: hypothetical protein JOY58_10220 [Solirubrobacterales bacterium]|nr:hypothetical protein [Solirubrobacterales bacterium]